MLCILLCLLCQTFQITASSCVLFGNISGYKCGAHEKSDSAVIFFLYIVLWVGIKTCSAGCCCLKNFFCYLFFIYIQDFWVVVF